MWEKHHYHILLQVLVTAQLGAWDSALMAISHCSSGMCSPLFFFNLFLPRSGRSTGRTSLSCSWQMFMPTKESSMRQQNCTKRVGMKA